MDCLLKSFYRTIEIMSKCINSELNRRSRVMHWRNNKITPPFLTKAWKLISRTNFTDEEHKKRFVNHHWSPRRVILFGSENSLNINIIQSCYLLIVTSREDHLEIFDEIVKDKNSPFIPDEVQGSQMNGVIIPFACSTKFKILTMTMENIINYDLSSMYRMIKLTKRQVKLVIVFAGDYLRTDNKTADRASTTIQILRKDLHIPICTVVQLDTRKNERPRKHRKNSSVVFFRGSDIHSSTLVINTNDEETLKETFLNWKV
ncbi:unnamed protein product [Onchocerca flexuosa]|uniref:Uncharacterized protein n=1 Tax=Onchocerca flexuosa TaxID=387005 RepID=A0A183H7S0_9BILA|nr:unnamed protein product [Onchocerca flexuosa]